MNMLWIFVLSIAPLACCNPNKYSTQSVLRLYPTSLQDVQFVDTLFETKVDYWTDLSSGRPVDVQVERDQLNFWMEKLNENGINSEVSTRKSLLKYYKVHYYEN